LLGKYPFLRPGMRAPARTERLRVAFAIARSSVGIRTARISALPIENKIAVKIAPPISGTAAISITTARLVGVTHETRRASR